MLDQFYHLVKNPVDASFDYIARLLMDKYSSIYKCTSLDPTIWFEHRDNKWTKLDNPDILRDLIWDYVGNEYFQYQFRLRDLFEKGEYSAKKYHQELNNVSYLIKKLNRSMNKTLIMKEWAKIAYDKHK